MSRKSKGLLQILARTQNQIMLVTPKDKVQVRTFASDGHLNWRPKKIDKVGKTLLPYACDPNSHAAWQKSNARIHVDKWVQYKGWVLGDFHNRDKIVAQPPPPPEKWLPPLQCPSGQLARRIRVRKKQIEKFMFIMRGRFRLSKDGKVLERWEQVDRYNKPRAQHHIFDYKIRDLDKTHSRTLIRMGFDLKTWW